MARIIVPVGNQVLIRRRERAKTSAGGIYLPDKAADDDEHVEGEVLAIGPGRFVEIDKSDKSVELHRYAPMPCKPGELVIARRGGVYLEDGLYLICDHDILATFTGGN